jgi:tetratricopeptide (TPR) repeat protein
VPEIALHQYENEIDHLIEEARYLEALAHTRHILRQHPRYIGAYYLLGKTMLEAGQPELAIDMFQRALNADPEHLMARIGLTLAHQRLDNLDAAIWNLERAIELTPGDADLTDELRLLYGRRDGFEPERVPLNRAGLARLYMRGNRPGRAVEELRALLTENPQRLDLRLALAEAYWRDDQIVQAADTCQTLLDDARHCLKANLLLGALWIDSGQDEGQTYLDRAQEIDLENTLANEMFGAASPLKPREVRIERLTYKPDALDVDQQAKWFQRLEAASVSVSPAAMQPEMTESEARLVDITAGLEAQIELPDWLRELGDEEEGALSWMADIGAEAEAEQPVAEPVAEAEMPDWLREEEVEEITAEEAVPGVGAPGAGVPEMGIPDWLGVTEPEEVAPEAEAEGFKLEEEIGVSEGAPGTGVPDWLSELEPAVQAEEGAPEAGAPGAGIPDWLQALQPTAPAAEEVPLPEAGAPGADVPDWLSELKRPGEVAEVAEGEPSPEVAPAEEVPDWLQSLQPAAPAEEEAEAVTAEEELPDWMEDFTGVGETTEETLAAEEGALPDWLTEFQPGEAAEAAAVAPTEEAPESGIPDWLSEFQPAEAQVEEAPVAEEIALEAGAPGAGAPGAGVPDWLSELPLAAEPEAEAETVEEELLDWLDEIPTEEVAVTTEERLPEELILGEEVTEQLEEELAPALEEAPVAEGFFGWEAFGEEITEVEAAHVVEEEVGAPASVAEGERLSGDDALAWLESLTEGKEEELRAQAEAEAQVRVAEILGHKPAEPEPVVEEAAPVMAEAPAAEDISGLEAFGEEIEEGEAAPVEIAEGELDWESLAEQLEEVEGTVSEVAPVAEGEDALAWLESLDVGEAEEFFTEAEVEATELEPLAEASVEGLEEAPGAEGFFGWEAFGEEITEVAAPVAEGDFMSGDDALAWLESLAVGKEEELRAQGEAEAQARVAEILGHKPEAKPVEPEQVVEEPPLAEEEIPSTEGFFGWEAFGEEIAEVESAAPVIEEAVSGEVEGVAEVVAEDAAESEAESRAESAVLSGDDALAWLESLAAGKEEELRAQAEAETQARVDEILGRRTETRAEEPTAAEPVVEEPVVETPIEPEVSAAEIAAEVPVAEGDMMSGDDALAWFESLAAGKEEELRAQAEAEAQARVDEILGRKPELKVTAPEAPTPVVEEAPVEIAEEVALKEVALEEAAVEALEPEPVAEAPQAEPEAAPEEALPEEVLPEGVLVGIEPEEEAEYAELLAQARAAWKAGDVDAALAYYSQLIQAEAGLDEVIADLQEAIAEQPDNASLCRVLGDAYMANGMIDQAIEIFNQAMGML